MDAQRWQQVRALFDQVVDHPPSDWSEQLRRVCPDDPGLRADALVLLEADAAVTARTLSAGAHAPGLLQELVASTQAGGEDAWLDRRLGAWRIVRILGRGGMGQVYLAERDDGAYRQQAAIKLVRAGINQHEVLRRFRAERQILAGLQHPNIACLLDGGVSTDGVPWFALEYVDGVTVTAWCDRAKLSLPARLRVFLDICAAVAHAHERLVVHRDLKPGNILVDTEGRVKLLDFGIAKLIEPDSEDSTRTGTALRAFTPEYAAPEQIRGELMTTAVDVHALGLLLYELLTGRRAYRVTQRSAAAYERAVLEQEPTRPSSHVTRVTELAEAAGDDEPEALARRRNTTPQRLRALLRGDLDAIVLKALRKEPAQRYPTVRDLAEDVRAVLQARPVVARRGGFRYRAGRFLRRHALATAFAGLAVLALVGGLAVALWQAHEARVQRDSAHVEAQKARRVVDFLNDVFQLADPAQSRAGSVTARELLAQAAQRIRSELTEEPTVRAELLTVIGRAQLGVGLYQDGLELLETAVAQYGHTDAGRARAVLAETEALQNLGRYRDVITRLDGLAPTPNPTLRAARLLAADVAYRRALALQALSELPAAESAYREAIATRTELLGADASDTLDAQMRYSVLLTLQQRYEEARTLADAVLARVRAQAEVAPLRLGEALWALAIAEDNLDDDDRAEALFRERLAVYESAFGQRHQRTGGALNDLASIAYQRHDYATAERLFARALELFTELVGADHPSVATYQNNLGSAIMAQGRVAEARPYLERGHAIRLRHYGADHHTVAASMHSLGLAYIRLDEPERGEAALVESLRIYEKQFGGDSARLIVVLADLALARFRLSRTEAGCAASGRAAAIAAATGLTGGNAAFVQAMQGQCLRLRGDHQRGDIELAAALVVLRKEFGERMFRTQVVADLLESGRPHPP